MGKADRPRLVRFQWAYLILDEGHRVKNSECKLVAELKLYRSRARLLLTGGDPALCCQSACHGRPWMSMVHSLLRCTAPILNMHLLRASVVLYCLHT